MYSVIAISTFVCFAWAQQAPDPVAPDTNPASLQLRAQTGPNNTVTLTWRGGDPTSPGFAIYESTQPPYYVEIAIVGPNVVSFSEGDLLGGIPYFFWVCDLLEPQTCSNVVRVRFPR
jgi:hypothetical protein